MRHIPDCSRWTRLLALGALLLVACADESRGDGRLDAARPDLQRDAPAGVDARPEGVADIRRDRSRLDARLDSLGLDAGKLDRSTSDSTKLDTGSPSACAKPAKEIYTWSSTMKACEDTAVKVNQCQAESLCNTAGGWHLCTATEYLQRGGAASGLDLAWIKACVRSALPLNAPADGLCDAACPAATVAIVDTAWACASGAPAYPQPFKYVGVRSGPMCYRIGVNDPKTAAFWAPLNVASPISSSAVCCAP